MRFGFVVMAMMDGAPRVSCWLDDTPEVFATRVEALEAAAEHADLCRMAGMTPDPETVAAATLLADGTLLVGTDHFTRRDLERMR